MIKYLNQSILWIILAIVILLCFLYACSGKYINKRSNNKNKPTYQIITAAEAYQMMQKLNKFVLLDVRTNEEFLEKHIDGAILIPSHEIENRVEIEIPDKNTVILIYCRSGARASSAAKILVGKGYMQVFNFGGIINWPYATVSGK
ncbi:MAG: rhodanese-like domain-containing protein [Spirochaetaceae bacterium]|nr:rhodanese-like domain-containing protein [Spirochaetaceae bacterium]